MIRGRKVALTIIAAVVGLGLLVFIISRTRAYLVGPEITSTNAENIMYLDTHHFNYEAHIKNASHASINGYSLPILNDGTIQHVLALSPGTNHIQVELQDSFKHLKSYEYILVTPESLPEINNFVDTYEERILTP
jgi:hypothetical protein